MSREYIDPRLTRMDKMIVAILGFCSDAATTGGGSQTLAGAFGLQHFAFGMEVTDGNFALFMTGIITQNGELKHMST